MRENVNEWKTDNVNQDGAANMVEPKSDYITNTESNENCTLLTGVLLMRMFMGPIMNKLQRKML